MEYWEREAFKRLQGEHDVVFLQEPLNVYNAAEHAGADVVSTFIYSRLDTPVLRQLTNLKMIATRSTGFDHIDLDHCRRHGVVVSNVPTYGQNTVAEHVFGLLLTISHQMVTAVERTRRGDFALQGLQGFDLYGKTLGVVGTGEIGRCVIRIAKGFAMNVLGYDPRPNEQAAQDLGFRYVPLEELLRESDIITLHVPAIPQTRNFISHEQFNRMKTGVVLINTARGTVVDNRALLQALAEGKVAAAGLDVLSEEPIIREEAELLRSVYRREHDPETILADHVLMRLRNVYITPHSAFNTREAVGRILDTTVENIDAFARGQPHNVVGESAPAQA